MKKAHALLAGLISGTLMGTGQCTTLAEHASATSQKFEIMTDQEIRQHRDRMAKLSAEAREAYRNAEYEKLKMRALDQGYRLPDQAPWREPTSAEHTRADTRIAAADGDAQQADPMPGEAYRATMKQRFERYLEQRERRRAAAREQTRPDSSPAARSAEISKAAAERREQAAKRRDEALAEQKARRERHQAEMDARLQAHKQEMQERTEQLEARSERRQAELLELRAEAGKSPAQTPPPSQDSVEAVEQANEVEPVSQALARMREANAAEREKLSQETEQRIEQQRVELEALRDQQDTPAGTIAETQQATPRSGETRQARMAQRRAEAEAELQALHATPPDKPVNPETTEKKPSKHAPPESDAQPRAAAPAAGYYRHPVYPAYPAAPYPAYPYYPNPYWLPPR